MYVIVLDFLASLVFEQPKNTKSVFENLLKNIFPKFYLCDCDFVESLLKIPKRYLIEAVRYTSNYEEGNFEKLNMFLVGT